MSIIGNYIRIRPTRLAELLSKPDSIMDFLYPDDLARLENHLDLDKAWHAIHFLLNGQAWDGEPPLVNAVLGGEAIGNLDVGYGPARFLDSNEVRALAEALSKVSPTELIERFDSHALNAAEIYPQGWSGEDHERQYIADNYQRLVAFMQSAAEAGDVVIAYLN